MGDARLVSALLHFNDGDQLATAYDGLSLISHEGLNDSLEIIVFWHPGRRVKAVPLRAIVPDRSILRDTVSHFEWGEVAHINEKNQLVVNRLDGRVFRFT
jgi:hypothetical protein